VSEFAGRVVLITGASSGIGAALAREFAARGADLALCARRLDRLERLAGEIRARGRRALAIRCDVTRDGDCEAAVARTLAELGRLDAVVANAGFGVVGRLDGLGLEDYRRQFESNVFGVLRTVYAALDALKAHRGRLAIMGSVAGHVGAPGSSAYAMSKFALRGLAAALRHELAPDGVAVTLISPGFVTSEIHQVDNRGRHHPEARDVYRRLRMPADRAARQIVRAMARRSRERVITGHGQALVFLARHAPGLLHRLVQTFGPGRGRPEPGRPPAGPARR
jgi:short-subunit dehydrogenase